LYNLAFDIEYRKNLVLSNVKYQYLISIFSSSPSRLEDKINKISGNRNPVGFDLNVFAIRRNFTERRHLYVRVQANIWPFGPRLK